MFGFLSPRPHSGEYRQVYARMCVHLRKAFGVRSLPFHSYEAVFLYQLALDAGAFPASVMPEVRCCKLSRPGNLDSAADAQHGRFAAAFALLLADIKLTDDIHDSGSWLARGVRFVLRGRLRAARLHLSRFHPTLESDLQNLLAAHATLERRTDAIPLVEYVEPTAQAFGMIFGMAAKLPGLQGHEESLTAIGRGVGSALIAFDCAVDWKRDRQRNEFNPLADAAAVRGALRFAVNELDEVSERCRRAFGSASRAARTATAVADRLASHNPLGATCSTVPAWKQALAFFRAQPVYAMAGPAPEEPAHDVHPPAETPEGEPGKPWRKKGSHPEEPKDKPSGSGKSSGCSSCDSDCCGCTCCALEGLGGCGECCGVIAACG